MATFSGEESRLPRTVHVAAAATVVFVAFSVMIVADWFEGRTLPIIDDVVLTLLAAGATVACVVAARAAVGRLRSAWWALALGVAAYAVGEVIWLAYELSGRETPFPSWADAFFLTLPIAACTGLLLFPVDHSGESRGRLLLDGVIVAGSLFLVSWVTILAPMYSEFGTHRLGFAVSVAYPVSDVVMLTVAAVVLLRGGLGQRLVLTLLTLGLASIALADIGFAYLTVKNLYASGNVIDIGWVAGLLLITVAAAASCESSSTEDSAPGLPGWASIWLPYTPVLLAAVVVAANPGRVLRSGPVEVAAGVLVVAVLMRQFLAVSENRRLLAAVAEQAVRDPLTGLGNRALFNDRLGHALQLRQRGDTSVGLISLDLNDFKLVNDTLGHPAGDELLKEAAARILGAVRSGDTVARIGGDEFAVLVEDRSPDFGQVVANRVVESFREPFTIDGHGLLIHPSVGLAVAAAGGPALTAEELLKRADVAMYSSKRSQAAGLRTFSAEMQVDAAGPVQQPPSASVVEGAEVVKLLGELRRAIDQSGLALVYQPKFDLRTSAIVGVEALVRWPHSERGLIAPGVFLPLVRQHDLMGSVTDLVLRRALDDVVAWRAASVDVPVAVNIFAPTLADQNLPGWIAAALSDRGLDPSALTVEITEHQLVDDLEGTQAVLKELRQSGTRISIDDFGSGYSTVSYLRDLQVDEVKLDRDFIAPVLGDERVGAVVRAVINLAHELGLTTVGEGIEDAETDAVLRGYGCDIGQGNYYSPPLTSEEFVALARGLR